MNDEVLQLARRFSSTPSHGPPGTLFPVASQGPLNPASEAFDARQWAKAFYDIRTDTSEGTPPKTTGIAFKDLHVYGFGTSTAYQKSVGNVFLGLGALAKRLAGVRQERTDILHDLEGVVNSGELLAVLGPPGSGCSTFLKTVAGDTHGFHVGAEATINYQGIHPKQMRTAFRGEAIYTAEVDDHFPHLTVGDTLYFAARARCPKNMPEGVTRREYAEHLRDVTMAMFGISHTLNTRVGDDFVRGVSGGERKRVTIAEAALSYSPLQCWDNSTRGLDSANALEFCRTLRLQGDIMGCTSCVAIYQASQDAYDVFDKVLVLYEGRQIYFGKTDEAKGYFEGLGFDCPSQQTTADFLTSMTSPQEHVIRPGWEDKTPRTPDEFSKCWKESRDRARLMEDIEAYLRDHPFHGEHFDKFLESRRIDQSRRQRAKSPYTLSYVEQMRLTLWRSAVMLRADPSITVTMLITNIFQALIVSSIFYNLPVDTSSLYRRATLLFFIIIMNAFGSILEIMTLYAKRRVVEKHNRYALYHPSAEALSAMVVDLPYKVVNAVLFNIILYFMGNLRREPGAFFFFLLISFTMTLTMSMLFRLIGSVTKSLEQALAPSSIILLVIALYTGFAITPQYMQDWLAWLRWLNPVYYGLESLLLNEFVGRRFRCAAYVPMGPGYDGVSGVNRVCMAPTSVAGEDFVDGTRYLASQYSFVEPHKWRNFGVMIAWAMLYLTLHLVASEYVAGERSEGEVLVFSRGAIGKRRRQTAADEEKGTVDRLLPSTDDSESVAGIERQTSVFHWKDVCYDIKIKGEGRRILDNVDGWVKPGTLTALMGVSGAGKTTLLDVLATRVTMGVISGEMLVNGHPRDHSFQRKTGYVQQQDLHLHTSTVREALTFSALLRQPGTYTQKEKLDYVDTVIGLLNMEEYSDAVIGKPGVGLNVEQRKRLTIGVELAARPQLLLFLDEPTSGLDSQTSWSICNLMEKLTRSGQAILCTIHQPSAMLFQRFNRLLLLARGGRTVYFGEIGQNSQRLVDYLVRNGGPPCPPGANPAEYMLEVIGAAPGAHTDVDWPAVWRTTPEYRAVQDELANLASGAAMSPSVEVGPDEKGADPGSYDEFAAGFRTQFSQVTLRVFQQYWRSPGYIYSKGMLTFGAALFIGLSFLNAANTQRGLQNQMFGVFIFLTIFSQLVNQIMPIFVSQRTMYEARERPSKAYSWVAFLGANMLVEMFWNSVVGLLSYICWYYPIGLYRNAEPTRQVHSRGITMFLLVWVFFIFGGTFAHMAIAGLPSADIAGGIVNLVGIMLFTFCGILAGPQQLPRFWIFMYRVNPFTYVVEGFLGTSLANAAIRCSADEFVRFAAPGGQTCAAYLAGYIAFAGGYLEDPGATQCSFCSQSSTNDFLRSVNVSFGNRWRDFGIVWVYCIFNLAAAAGIYWLVRMPRKAGKAKRE
ncbi:ZEB2-regulated ABC transporter 1 [Colletotrichum orbiculare MAFF 240422]|uniref:ZEB2-regulated ABC transporter 1 n=1 Tax=Colletotrichum orbiculare (strain 104-T / ATCC 96160 / CBS 514.97 / LARS 414 / MAFF 240422) TaxID=1213857 RepID=N4VQZ7_COLOR|nr:ZEB2-regulated ABC transporter 1 [Colletotrichum orbiculare MAFF 240422]